MRAHVQVVLERQQAVGGACECVCGLVVGVHA